MKTTTTSILEQKTKQEKITMLTAYDFSTAKLMDECGVDSILVGDSLGMVMLGYDNTLPVTMEDMIHHGSAVARGCRNALVVVDMPFLSYQVSVEQAVANAGRLMKETGAGAVKLEGGVAVSDQIHAITRASIPVIGHIGLTPQSVNALGGFKVQGKSREQVKNLMADAQAVEQAGAFAVVLECVPAALASFVTGTLRIPTIGIGAGAGCDGQVLVYQDMLSLYSGKPAKFVKQFANIDRAMEDAFHRYIDETRKGVFPGEEHSYTTDMDEKLFAQLWEECSGK